MNSLNKQLLVDTDLYKIIDIDGKLYVHSKSDVTVIDTNTVNTIGVTTINIANDCKMNVNGEFNLSASKINLEAEGDISIKTNSDLMLYAEKSANIKSVGVLAADGSIIDLNNNSSKLPQNVKKHADRINLRDENVIYSTNCNCN